MVDDDAMGKEKVEQDKEDGEFQGGGHTDILEGSGWVSR